MAWCRPAAVALIRPLAWELTYATSVALKSKKKKSSLVMQWVKDLALSTQWLSCCCAMGFSPWPENFHLTPKQPKKIFKFNKVYVLFFLKDMMLLHT